VRTLPAMPEPPADPAPDAQPLAALGEALSAVGDRWTLLLIAALLDGPRRFGDLEGDLGGIAPNVLIARLRRLEAEGLVLAEPYSERPPRHVYELTAAGRGLAGALRLLADWGARHGEDAAGPRHAACGTPLEAVWWCPTCERPAGEDERGDVSHV
jgi:DNA-binding HxlR family transcriptional regulator